MPIKYSCFISYRSPCAEEASHLHSSLIKELPKWTNLPIFRDKTGIDGGDFLEGKLALALCESACMIMIYSPNYFDKDYTYCAREFKAMEILEAKRFRMLGGGRNEKHGLIIPVIYRGSAYFPSPIKSLRRCYDFESISMRGESYLESVEYREVVKNISEYIFLRCNELNSLDKDPCRECSTFDLPSIGEISSWLPGMLPPKPVSPGRCGRKP